MTVDELLAGVVIPIDKPRQWTSFQTVNKVKSIIRNQFGLKKFKIGHAGTLDPLATGLLLVCVGRATKDIALLQSGKKVYSGTMVLGATTPCHDLEQPIDHYYPYEHITPETLDTARQQFIGDIEQIPPIFSAVKIDGRRAYEYARADDRSAEPIAKTVHIDSFEITGFRPGKTASDKSDPSDNSSQFSFFNTHPPKSPHLYNHPVEDIPDHLPQADFRIHCGKGTYIRSMARDMGVALQSGAFLSALRREAVGTYHIEQSIPLDQVKSFLQ